MILSQKNIEEIAVAVIRDGIRCILIARLRTLPFGEPGIRSIIVR